MSAPDTLTDVTSRMRSVGLEEVLATAELQIRIDRKYLVPLDRFAVALGHLVDDLCVLQIDKRRLFRYESVYFDTPGLSMYRQHAHGRRRRVKVRTRAYLDSGECVLEFKRVGSRGQTVKARYPYHLHARHGLNADGLAFARSEVGHLVHVPALHEVMTTAYDRATLLDQARGNRVTCDVNLRFQSRDGRRVEPVDGFVLVESKTMGAESPVDGVLRGLGSRPVSLSKYCVGMALLDPGLPANRWNRELRDHFGWTPRR